MLEGHKPALTVEQMITFLSCCSPGSHLCVCAQVRDARGRRVGRCKEWAKVVGDDQVDARVLAMRHKDLPYVPKLQKATKPERVMTYRSALATACLYNRMHKLSA